VVDTSREEGILEGIEKGIEKRNIEIAKEMKEAGESIEKIMKYTNLSEEEINEL
jgi:predicted transposase/invertase (TIGR01784 family)